MGNQSRIRTDPSTTDIRAVFRRIDANQKMPTATPLWWRGVRGGRFLQEVTMLKTAAAAITVLLVAASPIAHAQSAPTSKTDASANDSTMLTDVRIQVIKAALQLTPAQEKYWPAVEQAIRFRAKDRQERVAKLKERIEHLHEGGPAEFLRNPDPVEFLNSRSGTLAQRSADLKKLADAWQPLYQTLDADQKQRMRFVAMFLIAKVRDAAGQARDEDIDDE
ncbi:MAG TPA: Spy/CpxP family protein refolding chaperone [Xanthobacteraceae bacterium]